MQFSLLNSLLAGNLCGDECDQHCVASQLNQWFIDIGVSRVIVLSAPCRHQLRNLKAPTLVRCLAVMDADDCRSLGHVGPKTGLLKAETTDLINDEEVRAIDVLRNRYKPSSPVGGVRRFVSSGL